MDVLQPCILSCLVVYVHKEEKTGCHCTCSSDVLMAAEDMRGFSGDPRLGLCLTDVYVKGKIDVLNIAFGSEQDKSAFVRNVGTALQELASARVRPQECLLLQCSPVAVYAVIDSRPAVACPADAYAPACSACSFTSSVHKRRCSNTTHKLHAQPPQR